MAIGLNTQIVPLLSHKPQNLRTVDLKHAVGHHRPVYYYL